MTFYEDKMIAIKSSGENYAMNITLSNLVFYLATPPGAPSELAKRGSSVSTFFVSICLSVYFCVYGLFSVMFSVPPALFDKGIRQDHEEKYIHFILSSI